MDDTLVISDYYFNYLRNWLQMILPPKNISKMYTEMKMSSLKSK